MLRSMRLRVAVPLLLLGVGLFVASLFVVIELRQNNERAVASAIRQLGVLCGIMVEDVEKNLRRGDRSRVRDTFRPIRASRTTRAAVLLDDTDRVIQATERGTEGYELSRTRFAAEAALVDSVRRNGRAQYRLDERGRLLWAHPFSMPPRKGELLPSRTGVLLVLYSLDSRRDEALRDAFSRSGTALLMLALLCTLVTWVVHRYFTPRIDALVRSTERIAAGDYRAVPDIAGDDEIATIAGAIAEMAARLDREQGKLLKSEADLRKLNAELEVRVRERTAESIAYALDMESFAFIISHDLRTPLRSIAGFAQVLAQDNAAIIGKEGLENVGRVLLNAKRMNRLMDDILALARHGRGQPLEKAEVDVTALARAVAAELLGERRDASRIHVRIDAVPPAFADERLLRQVIRNLLSNAIKYSAVRETAEIYFGANVEARGTVYFVSDNGIGFEMKYADQIFAPFKRLNAPTEYEGTGVGLAIVRRVLERHGGSVWVRSEFGVGTTFFFAFFLTAEAAELARLGEADLFRRVGEVMR